MSKITTTDQSADPSVPEDGRLTWYSRGGEPYVRSPSAGIINLTDVGIHASQHVKGGSDEIDGDQVDVDYIPTNYVRDISPSEVTDIEHLTAHLAGLDIAIGSLGGGVPIIVEEGFIGSNLDVDELGKLGWRTSGNGAGNALTSIQVSGRYGIVRIEPGTAATNGRRAINLSSGSVENFTLSSGVGNTVEDEWLVRPGGTLGAVDLEGIYCGWVPESEVTTNGRPQLGFLWNFNLQYQQIGK